MKILSLTAAAFISSTDFQRPPSTARSLLPTLVTELPPARSFHQHENVMTAAVHEFLTVRPAFAADAVAPPTPKEVALLREALAAFYGVNRDVIKAQELLSQAIEAWQKQAPDERAALYRVRGDCYMALLKPQEAQKDYTIAIDLLEGPGGDLADPSELPAATYVDVFCLSLFCFCKSCRQSHFFNSCLYRLGRARSIRSQGVIGKDLALQAAKDYQKSLRLSSREEWDTDQDMEEDGAARNPYAAWEWGSSLRQAGMYEKAAEVHSLASVAFDDIGDRAHSVISLLDAGIDLAAAGKIDEAKSVLQNAIKRTTLVEGRDVELLQRVIAKEGEARMALASILWDTEDRAAAETQLGDACIRLEQLEADAQARISKLGLKPSAAPDRLKFSIDDDIGAFDISCSKFKNEKFLTETLQWPETLQKKVNKLQSLKT